MAQPFSTSPEDLSYQESMVQVMYFNSPMTCSLHSLHNNGNVNNYHNVSSRDLPTDIGET